MKAAASADIKLLFKGLLIYVSKMQNKSLRLESDQNMKKESYPNVPTLVMMSLTFVYLHHTF